MKLEKIKVYFGKNTGLPSLDSYPLKGTKEAKNLTLKKAKLELKLIFKRKYSADE